MHRKKISSIAANCLFIFCMASVRPSFAETDPSIQVETYQQERIVSLLPLLNAWADREFSQYPYLLSSPEDQIVCPSDLIFVNSSDAMIALARLQGQIVGMAAMISFDSPIVHSMYFERFHLSEKMRALDIDYNHMLYIAYFLTAPKYHNDPHVVSALYHTIADFAQEKGKTQVCFMEDIGQQDHQTFIEPWGDVIDGCRSLKLQIGITWPTLDADGSVKDLEHTLEFFVKDL